MFACCHSNGKKEASTSQKTIIKINRFEDIIFQTPSVDLGQVLKVNEHTYRFLFNTNLSNVQYFQEISAFASDTVMQQVYQVVKATYPDLSFLEKELGIAMSKAETFFPNSQPKVFYSLITGTFGYYDRIICTDSFMAINIDQYAIKNMRYFNNYFGMPQYIVNMLDSSFLVVDCMTSYAINLIPQNSKELSMLDYMILNGKILYFLDQILPDVKDYMKIRYTPEQMKWALDNEENVWGYFIQKKLLYETDYTKIRTYVNEAPGTSSFQNSAPRLTDFLGWQIVRKYMSKNKVSMKELFQNVNSQRILTESGYKPIRK